MWLISQRATVLVNKWLNNKHLSVPHGNEFGAILIPRKSVEHARDSRAIKDKVGNAGVIELLSRLFVDGTPKYVLHPDVGRYPNQLLMFDPAHRSREASSSGEAAVAALQFVGTPVAHLRLETACWAKPAKIKALESQALEK